MRQNRDADEAVRRLDPFRVSNLTGVPDHFLDRPDEVGKGPEGRHVTFDRRWSVTDPGPLAATLRTCYHRQYLHH